MAKNYLTDASLLHSAMHWENLATGYKVDLLEKIETDSLNDTQACTLLKLLEKSLNDIDPCIVCAACVLAFSEKIHSFLPTEDVLELEKLLVSPTEIFVSHHVEKWPNMSLEAKSDFIGQFGEVELNNLKSGTLINFIRCTIHDGNHDVVEYGKMLSEMKEIRAALNFHDLNALRRLLGERVVVGKNQQPLHHKYDYDCIGYQSVHEHPFL